MNPALITSQTTHGNLELERVLKQLAVSAGASQPSGNVYYVIPAAHPNYTQFVKFHNKKYEDSTEMIHTTISAAYSACTASRGDVILVDPTYTETVTAVKTLSKIGVSIIGLGQGLNRPTITGNGTIDVFSLTGANQTIENIVFAAPETDNQTADINVAAAGCVIRNTYHIGSKTAKNKTDIITIASGADDLVIDGVLVYNVTVDCVSAISLEAAVARPIMKNLLIQGTFSTAAVMDEAAATLVTIKDSIIKNSKAATAVLDFTNNSTGICSFLHVSGRHTTIASNIVAGTGMDFFEVRVTEEAALNGAIIPAADTD